MTTCTWCGGEINGNAMHVKEPWRLQPHNCELIELRALRDRLVACIENHKNGQTIHYIKLMEVHARAEELAK